MSDDYSTDDFFSPDKLTWMDSGSSQISRDLGATLPRESLDPGHAAESDCTSHTTLPDGTFSIVHPMPSLPECGFMTEKVPGNGEDSHPLEFHWEGETGRKTLLAVFDGMGGAGSRKVPHTDAPATAVSMAYLASRAARGAVLEACHQITAKMQAGEIVKLLEEHIQRSLQRLVDREGGVPASRMVGTMVRDYPTTVAVALIEENEKRNVHMMWAGDSRVYLLSPDPTHLLQQLTLDHTSSGASSDGGDAALTRCATPDSVDLEYNNIEIPDDAIVFVATDGCFAYESSLFFLTTLIEQLDRSPDAEQYGANLADALSSVAGDDCSMAMSLPPALDFESIKSRLNVHLRNLQDLRNIPRNNPFVVLGRDEFYMKLLTHQRSI